MDYRLAADVVFFALLVFSSLTSLKFLSAVFPMEWERLKAWWGEPEWRR